MARVLWSSLPLYFIHREVYIYVLAFVRHSFGLGGQASDTGVISTGPLSFAVSHVHMDRDSCHIYHEGSFSSSSRSSLCQWISAIYVNLKNHQSISALNSAPGCRFRSGDEVALKIDSEKRVLHARFVLCATPTCENIDLLQAALCWPSARCCHEGYRQNRSCPLQGRLAVLIFLFVLVLNLSSTQGYHFPDGNAHVGLERNADADPVFLIFEAEYIGNIDAKDREQVVIALNAAGRSKIIYLSFSLLYNSLVAARLLDANAETKVQITEIVENDKKHGYYAPCFINSHISTHFVK